MRREIAATILAGSIAASGLNARPVEAKNPPASPISTSGEILTKTEQQLTENPLIPRPGFTPEIFLVIGGAQLLAFDSPNGTQVEYTKAPADGTDGIYPTITTDFLKYYLKGVPENFSANDLTWKKISTDISEIEATHMSAASINSDGIEELAAPESFGAYTIYQDGGLVENYMEFQIPDTSLAQATETDYFLAVESVLNIPDIEETPMNISFNEFPMGIKTDENGNMIPEFIERYFTVFYTLRGETPEEDISTIILINQMGNVHLLETHPDVLSLNLGFDVTASE